MSREYYVLDFQPESGSYRLWTFDPSSHDPLPTRHSSFDEPTRLKGSVLLHIDGYILERWEEGVFDSHHHRLWKISLGGDPLPNPPISENTWGTISTDDYLFALKDTVISPGLENVYYDFKPDDSDPLPVNHRTLPWATVNGFVGGNDSDSSSQLVPLEVSGKSYVLYMGYGGNYSLWNWDTSHDDYLQGPITEGTWQSIDHEHRLIGLGEYILDWKPKDKSYKLWKVKIAPDKDPIPNSNLIQQGYWKSINENHELIAVLPR